MIASRPVSRVLSLRVAPHSMTIHLERPSPDASRNLPGRLGRKQPWHPLRGAAPPLFGLAPGGVCHAAPVAGGAVRSCRTISPLRQALGPVPRYHFCGTVPGVAPAGRYPAPCFHGARTFLSRTLSGLAAAVIQPAGRGEVGYRGRNSNDVIVLSRQAGEEGAPAQPGEVRDRESRRLTPPPLPLRGPLTPRTPPAHRTPSSSARCPCSPPGPSSPDPPAARRYPPAGLASACPSFPP
jgi:hypothetical protein